MPRERAGTGPERLESPTATSSNGSSGSSGSGRISPGSGVAGSLAESITSRRRQQQQQQHEAAQQQAPVRMAQGPAELAGTTSRGGGARRRPRQISVETDEELDEPFGATLKPTASGGGRPAVRVPATARSARDLRPSRLGLMRWPGDADTWGGHSPGSRMVRAVSVRGGESPAELDRLHELAQQRSARRLQRHKALALAVWDGHHDLVSHRARLDSSGDTGAGGASGVGEAASDNNVWGSVPALSLMLILCGCGSQLPYELMNSSDRGCGALTSVCEAVFGLALTAPAALRQESWSVPVATHAWLAGAAVLYPLLLNQALASPLPVVLLSTLKNGNLVANAIVGVLLLGKRYSARQLLSVALVSTGNAKNASISFCDAISYSK